MEPSISSLIPRRQLKNIIFSHNSLRYLINIHIYIYINYKDNINFQQLTLMVKENNILNKVMVFE